MELENWENGGVGGIDWIEKNIFVENNGRVGYTFFNSKEKSREFKEISFFLYFQTFGIIAQ